MRRSSSARCPAGMARYLAAGAAADYFFDVWWRRGSPPCSSTPSRSIAAGSNPRSVSREGAARARRAAADLPRGRRAREDRRAGHASSRAPPRSPSPTERAVRAGRAGRRRHRACPAGRNGRSPAASRSASSSARRCAHAEGESADDFTSRIRAEIVRLRDAHADRILGARSKAERRSTRVTDVKHMKWWGWGVEGVGFHYEDKPGFAPFVLKAVGLDLHTAERAEEPVVRRASRSPKPRRRGVPHQALAAIVGDEYVTHRRHGARRAHLRQEPARPGAHPRQPDRAHPDVVVYPADEAEVQAVVDAAVAADAVHHPVRRRQQHRRQPRAARRPRSAPSSRSTSAACDQVIDIDADSGLARIQAGALGPDLEAQLNEQGWTIGHFPDSFTHSTVGGWVATRSSGMQSDKYGDIAAHRARPARRAPRRRARASPAVPATSTGRACAR